MEQFVVISYTPDFERVAVQLDVTSKPEIAQLVANKSGMAYLAGLVADFLTFLDPKDHVYEVGPEQGLVMGSPTLCFAFDPAFDHLDGDSLL